MRRFLKRATEGMNERFSTDLSAPLVELLFWTVVVLVIGTAFAIGMCFAFGDVRWEYFAGCYFGVAVIILKIFYL
jgi:hypothetical protein